MHFNYAAYTVQVNSASFNESHITLKYYEFRRCSTKLIIVDLEYSEEFPYFSFATKD